MGQGQLYEDKGSNQVIRHCDADGAGSPIDRHSTIGYYVSIGTSIVLWKSKKEDVVWSGAKSEYNAVATTT